MMKAQFGATTWVKASIALKQTLIWFLVSNVGSVSMF